MIRVLIADDQKILTDGITAFLEKESDIEVVGEAQNGNEVLQILEKQMVDVAVLDIEMPEMNGIETTKIIKKKYPNTKVLILSMYKKREYILNMMYLGVNGYILKNKSKEELVGAIHNVYRGIAHFGLEITNALPTMSNSFIAENVLLTTREKEVLCVLARNPSYTYGEIGEHLSIAEVTVQAHIRNIKGKLGLKKKMELMKYVIDNELCE